MKDSTFSPGTINATVGATIEWMNHDGFSHTVTRIQFHRMEFVAHSSGAHIQPYHNEPAGSRKLLLLLQCASVHDRTGKCDSIEF